MWLSFVVIVAVTMALFVLVGWKERGIPWDALRESGQIFVTTFPLIAAAFLCVGLLKALVPTEWVQKWMAEGSGWRGIFLGCLAGALTPGGPYTSFPIAMVLFRSGAGMGTVIAYLTAWSLWSFTRFPMEVAFLGAKIMLLRLLVTLFVPPLAGFLAHILTRLPSRF